MLAIKKLISLKDNHGFMRYFRNTSWLMLEKVLRMIAAFLVGVWVARYLGPEQLGILSYAQSLVFLFSAFATLGLDGVIVRELVKDPSKRDVLLGTAFCLKLIGAFISIGLLAVTVLLTPTPHSTQVIIFLVASGAIFHSFNVIGFYFESTVQSKFIVYGQFLSMLVINGLKIAFILYEMPLVYFAATACLEAFIISLSLVLFYKLSTASITLWSWDNNIAFSILKSSWPLLLSGLMVSLYMKIDQVMIMQMLDPESVGQYAAAVRLSEAWYFVPTIICNSLFPAIVNAKDIDDSLYCKRLRFLCVFLVVLAALVSIFFTVLGDAIVLILLGDEYDIAAVVLKVHIWSGIFVALGLVTTRWLLCENLTRYYLYLSSISLLINVVLNLVLIPKYGVIGCAFATFISYAFSGLFFELFSDKTRRLFFLKVKSFYPC